MELTAEILLNGYCQGYFPMGNPDGSIDWYDPNPRTILPLETFHAPRSLLRTIRQGGFVVRVNSDFRAVITACADPAPGRPTTWITPVIIDTYCQLHELGFAHSVETWIDGQLVGGLYGVAVNGLFAGESMFSRATDSSKIALVYLIERLRAGGYTLLDTQYMNKHLQRFGAVEIARREYKRRLQEALATPAQWDSA